MTWTLLVLLAFASSACSILQPRPDSSRFFVLATIADLDGGLPSNQQRLDLRLGLGPISIPDYIRRPEIVIRTGETELIPSKTDRWAEPVEQAVIRTITENLRVLLATPDVILFPWYSSEAPQVQLRIDIQRFELTNDGQATLTALWEARDLRKGGRRTSGQTQSSFPASADPRQAVRALSTCLAELARDTARAVHSLQRP